MRQTLRSLAAAFSLAAVLCAPAAAQGLDSATVEDLRYRIGVLDAELTDLRARLERAAPGTSVPRASGGGSDLSVRLDRLEVELGRLTGMVEEIAHRQRRMAEDAARRFGDIDFRLTELEGGDIGALGPQPPLGGPWPDDGRGSAASSPGVGNAASEREPPAATDGGSGEAVPEAPTASTGTGGGTGPATGAPRRRAAELELAIADVRQGRFDQGEDRLQRYIASDPSATAEAEASFWLGKSRFTRGEHSAAARAFLAGYNAERRGPLAADNLLQLGITLGRLGQKREACLTLREVRNQFPASGPEILEAADAEADALACGP